MLSLTLTAAYALLLSPLPPRAHTAGGPRCVSEPPDTIEERTITPSPPAPPPLRTPAPLAADAPPLAPPPQTPPPSSFPVAPQLTLSKYETMQGRRVRAVLAYAPAFAPLAAEVTAALGNALPDVKVQRVAAAPEDPRVPSISLRVDGVLCTSSTEPGRLYLPLSRIGVVVERARRKRRPKGDAYTSAAGPTRDRRDSKRLAEELVGLELSETWHPEEHQEHPVEQPSQEERPVEAGEPV